MNNIKKITFLLFTMLSPIMVFASDAVSNRATMVSSIYTLVTIAATAMGMMLMITAIVKLKRRGDNPNDPKSFPSSIIVTLFAGAMAFNYSESAGVMIASVLGDNDAGYCFVIEGTETSGNVKGQSKCWTEGTSEVLDGVADKIDKMSGNGAGAKIKENAQSIIALFQTIGLIYFLKGLYGLKTTSEGQSKEGYGKPIITLIASALIIDLPHTIEMVQETIAYLGFGV